MRYQSPVTSPLAHYWEEEISGFWDSWARFRAGGRKIIYLFIGDILLANLYLVLDILSGLSLVRALGSAVREVSGRINLIDSFKRTVDVFGSISGLIITLPICLVVSVLIKLDSKGPVFYTQLRVGKNRRRGSRRQMSLDGIERRQYSDRRKVYGFGKPFRILKFRTMYIDAEKNTGPIWASKSDPRVTEIGRILRRTRIDEIPQLLNVLIGDMSLVGPRPERPYFVAKLGGVVNDYLMRFDVKPGVTGLAQVEHKYDESIEDVDGKVRYDLKYIKNLSVIQDLKILIKTVIVVMTARGW
ncbi:MAG: sugar transferase [Candidatus Zixiibacteriota bacterium]|nr:MAG: sugar transferase [candidate division Zixibacteria bacterium]